MGKIEIKINKIVQSERNAIRQIEPVLFDLKEELKIKDESFYNMLIAVTEAVNNAIIHGNKCNPEKSIEFSLDVHNRDIIIIVKDQGRGFDYLNVADPREPENLLKASGRGVFLIKELTKAYEFSVNSDGTTVKMTFHI